MAKTEEKAEREARAERLVWARKHAGFTGPTAVQAVTGIPKDNIKAHEQGRNGFGTADARKYALAFGVSYRWLFLGEGEWGDRDDPIEVAYVPRVSWVTAGEMGEQEGVADLSDFPREPVADLPRGGRWIALKLEPDANSMNKISPPESIIFVDLNDRRLVPNACYVISDEQGRVTYKRYRPNAKPPFQPASYEEVPPPKLEGQITVIGRVRRSMIDM